MRSLASAISSSEYPTFLLIDTWATILFFVRLQLMLASCEMFKNQVFRALI